MTLEEVYFIGQTIAVVAILGSLGGIWFQMRQTNTLAREETSRTNLITFVTEQQRLFATPDDAAFMHKAMYTDQPLSPDEKARFSFTMALMFGLFEVAENTNQSGLFRDIDHERATDTIRLVYLISPRVRKWWASARMAYARNAEFLALVDSLVAEVEGATSNALEASQ